MAEHGTYAQAQQHKLAGEKPCEPCLEAQREYMRRWRAANPAAAHHNNRRVRARHQALEDLRKLHPDEFAALYANRRKEAGL